MDDPLLLPGGRGGFKQRVEVMGLNYSNLKGIWHQMPKHMLDDELLDGLIVILTFCFNVYCKFGRLRSLPRVFHLWFQREAIDLT